ncbi:MAG: PAN domain-containing protein [Lentilitoribacter sp.]
MNFRFTHISLLVLTLILVMAPSDPVKAAEFTQGENADCKIQMRGPILKGDLDKFKEAERKYHEAEIFESSAENTICLDSPGGSLAEAAKIAAYFYEKGVGTVIHDGQSCLSACSFIFMLGTAQGAEVQFVNRSMHPNATLGFHRPELLLDESKDYKGSAVVKSFDVAISSALNVLQISNNKRPFSQEPMVAVDLLKIGFTHRGQDFYFIDTIDKVGRWKINLLNLDPELLPKLNEDRAWNACENHFRWSFDISKKFVPHKQDPENTYQVAKQFVGKTGEEVYRVLGSDEGLLEASCVIKRDYDAVLACGYNELVSAELGSGRCDETNYDERFGIAFNSLLSMFHPDTKIAELAQYVRPAKDILARQNAYYKRLEAQSSPQQGNSQNSSQWTTYNGFDLNGGDLYVQRDISYQDCINICQNDGACSAATYDRWNSICILKDINNSWRLLLQQPKTDTIMRGDIAQNGVQFSQSQFTFKRRDERNFPAPNSPIVSFGANNSQICENNCWNDSQCHAYQFDQRNNTCSFFNLPGEYFPNSGTMIGIKEQLE